jgi:hypothetical protein
MTSTDPLAGWDIGQADATEWQTWGQDGNARARILAGGDGYHLAVIEADAGYTGTPHEHAHAELLYLLDGTIRNQGRVMEAGDGYVASAGSTHDDFVVLTPARYLSAFRL